MVRTVRMLALVRVLRKPRIIFLRRKIKKINSPLPKQKLTPKRQQSKKSSKWRSSRLKTSNSKKTG